MIRGRLLGLLGVVLIAALTAGGQSAKKEDKKESKKESKNTGVMTLTFAQGDGSYLGIFTEDVTSENAPSYKLKEERGVIVADIVEDSPAMKAGLKKDDVILEFNGEKLEGKIQLNRLINETPPGRTVELLVSRGGSIQRMKATLANRPERQWLGRRTRESVEREVEQAERAREQAEEQRERLAGRMRERGERLRDKLDRADGFYYSYGFSGGRRMLGVQTIPLTKQLAEYFGVSGGHGVLITVVEKDSAAEKAGLKAGDVVVSVDERTIEDASDLVEAINRKEEGPIALKVVRNKSEMQIQATPEERKRNDEGLFFPAQPFRIFPRGFLRVEPNLWLETDLNLGNIEFEIPQFSIPPIPIAPLVPPRPPVPPAPRYRLMTLPEFRVGPVQPIVRIDSKGIKNSQAM